MKKIILLFIFCSIFIFGIKNITLNVYANTSNTSANDSKNIVKFREIKTFKPIKDGTPILISNNGTIYYMATDNEGVFIYTLNSQNKEIKYSYRFKDNNGKKINLANPTIKQCGNYIYFQYTEADGLSLKGCKLVKFDQNLNLIKEYNMSKIKTFDTNGKKIAYIKEKSIYVSDLDGKNKKKIYTAGENDNINLITHIAISDEYVGFRCKSGYGSKTTCHCGIIDLNKEEITFYNPNMYLAENVKAIGNKIMWTSHYSYSDIREVYTYDENGFKTLKIEKNTESRFTIDNLGNIITFEQTDNFDFCIRIYNDGVLLGKYIANGGYCHFGECANDGVISIWFTKKKNGDSPQVSILSYS